MRYCPFPRLWREFEFKGNVLQRPFEVLDRAAKMQAMKGNDAALAYLKSTVATDLPWDRSTPAQDTAA